MGKLILVAGRPSTRSAVVIGFQGLADLLQARVDVIALLKELATEPVVSSFSSDACSPERSAIVGMRTGAVPQGRLLTFPKSRKANAAEPHEGGLETNGESKRMRRAWPFHELICETVGGRCHSCNTNLSREECADTRKLFKAHRRHFGSVTVFGRVASPVEYRGIDLGLTLDLLPRSRQLSSGIVRVSCLIFRLSCLHCDVQLFPANANDVLTFRNRHGSHVQALRLYVIVHTTSGRAVRKQLEVCGSGELCSEVEVSELVSEPEDLPSLRRTITCTLVGLKCTSCRSRTWFERDSDIADLVGQHEGHLSYVYLDGHVDAPQEYVDFDLNFLAHPFEWRSLQHELNVECLVFEMYHGNGKTSFVSLWHSADIRQCLPMYSRDQQGVRLRGLVAGKNKELFELEFALSLRSTAGALLELEAKQMDRGGIWIEG